MVQFNFDANQVAPNTGFEPVPEGWYTVAITESEMKETKDKLGAYLQLKLSIIDGPHANKPVFARLNVQNQNQQAVDIAYGELSAICHVTGVYNMTETTQLHGIPFQVRVIVEKGEKGENNAIKAYKDAAGNEPGKAPQGGGQPANFGGQPNNQQQPQGNQPQNNGGFQGQQPNQQQPNNGQPMNNGQPQNNGNNGFQGQQPTQPANNAPVDNNGGNNGGWTQNANQQQPNNGGNGGSAPWGNNQQ